MKINKVIYEGQCLIILLSHIIRFFSSKKYCGEVAKKYCGEVAPPQQPFVRFGGYYQLFDFAVHPYTE